LVELVGLDLGTTGTRYERYDLEGNILASGRSLIREQTTEEWIRSLRLAIRNRKKPRASDELLLSAQSTSGTVLMVDEYGNEVFKPIMYHEKAVEEFREIEKLKPVADLSRRGIGISSTSPLPKILRVKNAEPERFRKVRWILSPTVWLLYRLAYAEEEKWETISTDWTNALKFGADLTQQQASWFKPLFDATNISTDLLPRIVPCGEELGTAESEVATRLGLKSARIFHGMTDGNAAALAVGCMKGGDFGFSCGTTTAVKYVCDEMKPHQAIYYHKHPLSGYLAGAAPITAGMLDWFADKVMGIGVGKAFELAGKSEPGKEYLYFPQGDRSPFDDPGLGASFLGVWPEELSRNMARARMFRSMVLGLTFFEYWYITLFEDLFNRKIEEAKITGGGTRSTWWNRLRASVYDLPVKVMEERPGIGALMPVVLSLRLFKDAQEAKDSLLRVTDVHEPDKNLRLRYESLRDAFFKRWQRVREASSIVQG
jgi:xylulokinase